MFALFLAAALAQPPAEGGAVAFRQACLDAGTDAIVLNVAAHPDDEAARTLVYLRRTLGVRTTALFTTCGEGGQNAVGRDIGRALARRRVLETLAAAAHTDVDVRWLGFEDFGYSKSLEETLKLWGAARLERAMLEALFEIRPDVVLTNHDTERGHGHHRASAWAIERAIRSYAQRIGRDVPLYQRPAGDEAAPGFSLDVSRLDPVAGKTFARQAHDGLLEHASQGPWGPHDPARVRPERWKLVWPLPAASDAGNGAAIDPFARLPSAFDDSAAAADVLGADAAAVAELQRTLAGLREDRPVAALLRAAAAARALLARTPAAAPASEVAARLRRRLEALERAWLHGHGVAVEAYPLRQRVPLFGRLTMRVAVHAEEATRVQDLHVEWQGVPGAAAADGPLGALVRDLEVYLLPAGTGGERDVDPVTGTRVLRPTVTFRLAGVDLVVRPPVRVLPVPAIELAFDRDVCVLPRAARDARRLLALAIDYHGDGTPEGALEVTAPPGVACELRPARIAVSAERRDAHAVLRLQVTDPAALPPDAELVARYGGHEARLALRVVDVQLDRVGRVGVVRGPDDTLLRTLEDLGIDHVELDPRALAVAQLAEFSSLVLDMRTAGSRSDLRDHRERVLEFCARGGRVVAFYHKPPEWNARPGRPALAPYELVVGDARVAEEDAPVEILEPAHPLLAAPHPIGVPDFAGWVQERGLNFPSKWDAAWVPLLRMADTGEKPQDGALLVAPHGSGEFVYCSLGLYRQWRTGHRGALRLLVNLLAR
jgi:LmbE family N-acetylglucosaminyl deacetylase